MQRKELWKKRVQKPKLNKESGKKRESCEDEQKSSSNRSGNNIPGGET